MEEAVPHGQDKSNVVLLNDDLAVGLVINLSFLYLKTGVEYFVRGETHLANDLFEVIPLLCSRDHRARTTCLGSSCNS